MCQIVFSLDYYGKTTTKTYKSQGMQLSPMKTADVTLKTQNEIGGCLTQQIMRYCLSWHVKVSSTYSIN